MLGVLFVAVGVLAATQKHAIVIEHSGSAKGKILLHTSVIPHGSLIFEDEGEILASITAESYLHYLCSFRMTSLTLSGIPK